MLPNLIAATDAGELDAQISPITKSKPIGDRFHFGARAISARRYDCSVTRSPAKAVIRSEGPANVAFDLL